MSDPFEHRLYLSSHQVDELFSRLRRYLKETRCDDTFGESVAWAESVGIPLDRFLEGLRRIGARCDCQVAFMLWRMTPDTDLPYGMLI